MNYIERDSLSTDIDDNDLKALGISESQYETVAQLLESRCDNYEEKWIAIPVRMIELYIKFNKEVKEDSGNQMNEDINQMIPEGLIAAKVIIQRKTQHCYRTNLFHLSK